MVRNFPGETLAMVCTWIHHRWERIRQVFHLAPFRRGPMPFSLGQSLPMPVGEIVLFDTEFNILIGGCGYHMGDRVTQDQ